MHFFAAVKPLLVYFLLNEQPSTRRHLPPVGLLRMAAQLWQITGVWACEKTVVMAMQPAQRTSMKKLLGPCMSLLSLCLDFSSAWEGFNKFFGIFVKLFIRGKKKK